MDVRHMNIAAWIKNAGLSTNVLYNFMNNEKAGELKLSTLRVLASSANVPLSAFTLEMSDDDFECCLRGDNINALIITDEEKNIIEAYRRADNKARTATRYFLGTEEGAVNDQSKPNKAAS